LRVRVNEAPIIKPSMISRIKVANVYVEMQILQPSLPRFEVAFSSSKFLELIRIVRKPCCDAEVLFHGANWDKQR
jgi:hypothetical protein